MPSNNTMMLYAATFPNESITRYMAPQPPSLNPMDWGKLLDLPKVPPTKKKKFKTFVPGDSRLHILGVGGRIICVDAEGEYFNGTLVHELTNGCMYTITGFTEQDNVITHVRVKELDQDVFDVRRFIPAPPTPEELARDKSRINLIDLSDRDE